MFKNYLKIAFRNIIRHKSYTTINVLGLAVGMASSILILLWVQHEKSYDRFHKNADQTYRVIVNASGFIAAVNPAGMPAGLKEAIPQIKNTVRLSHIGTHLFQANELKFEEKRVFYADPSFLQVFNFAFAKGDAKTALDRVDGVLITQDMAKKYFGTENAIGKTLRLDNANQVTVTGVLANIPSNSHLQFDFILPMTAIANSNDDLKNNTWGSFNFYTYIQLDKSFVPTPAALNKLNAAMTRVFKQHGSTMKAEFQAQPMTSIHLSPAMQVDLPGHGNVQYVNIFFIVAIFILIVACINFMNLATARSARRAKEVGLRKVIGAVRGQLIRQFLAESLLISFFSLILALIIVWLFLPVFNLLADKDLSLHLKDAGILAGIAFITGLLSGIYPALILSGFQPIKVLKGNLNLPGGNLIFRNGLVIVQFVVSIVLLIGTAVVFKQLQYIRNRNMGFDKSNLLYIPITGELPQKMHALRTALEQNPHTANYTIMSELPINIYSGNLNVMWEGKDPNLQVVIPSLEVSEDFTKVFQINVLKGRGFSTAFNDSSSFVINETAVKLMGMTVDNAIGKPLFYNGTNGSIIGVVKDFNFKPIQQVIEPLILRLNRYGGYVVVKSRPGSTEATIKALEKISEDLNSAYPFNYNFLDQDIANQYKGEQQMSKIFNLFSILAIFISSLGLYGLSAFLAQQKTKEIGVRKVLGASILNIIYLLTTGFTRLVLIAVVIAIPISLLAINRWLETFAYHVQISWLIFVLGPLTALVIAWMTVSFEILKAAMINPVISLKRD
ncbi:ABC transporter permease [Chitinophaga sp.]|uniref:ABC transporter permease n=1 Tax=Chitinophaga sp. TaxID=1869181 RepID=UPI0031D68766